MTAIIATTPAARLLEQAAYLDRRAISLLDRATHFWGRGCVEMAEHCERESVRIDAEAHALKMEAAALEAREAFIAVLTGVVREIGL